MKNYSIILLLLLANFFIGYSQSYKFNLLTRYTIYNEDQKHEKIVYSNSDNQRYFLSLRKTENGNLAYLSDIENKLMHHLHFIENEQNGEIWFSFNYIKTEKLKPFTIATDYRFKFETIQQDSVYKTIKMTGYKNKKMTQVTGVTELKVKKHPKNLFPLYRFSYLHVFEFRTDIDLNENGIIESSKYLGNKKLECKLDYYKEIDLVIKI